MRTEKIGVIKSTIVLADDSRLFATEYVDLGWIWFVLLRKSTFFYSFLLCCFIILKILDFFPQK